MHLKGFLITLFILVVAMSGTALAGDTYDYKSICPKYHDYADKWSFYTCECTSYAADKMNEHGVKLNNSYKQPSRHYWSDASNWINAAKAAGVSYNTSPKNRDIAWFSYGHVAYVESVDSKDTISISEYNYYYPKNPYIYSTRSIKKGTSAYPKYFIHFGAK